LGIGGEITGERGPTPHVEDRLYKTKKGKGKRVSPLKKQKKENKVNN